MQISAQEFGNEVAAGPVNNAGAGRADRAGWPYISSRGEMKMSLSEITCRMSASQNLHASICMYVCMNVCMLRMCAAVSAYYVYGRVCVRKEVKDSERENSRSHASSASEASARDTSSWTRRGC